MHYHFTVPFVVTLLAVGFSAGSLALPFESGPATVTPGKPGWSAPANLPPRLPGQGWHRLSLTGLGDTDCLNRRDTQRCALETYIYREVLQGISDKELIVDYRLRRLTPYNAEDLPEEIRPSGPRGMAGFLENTAPHPSELDKSARLAVLSVRLCRLTWKSPTFKCSEIRTKYAVIVYDGYGRLDGKRIHYWQVEWFEESFLR